MVSDRHQALLALSETRNANNPLKSMHSSSAVSHDMPSSAAVLQIATVKLCLKLFDIPLAWTQRATPRRSPLPACTVDSTHPIVCKICLVNLEPRNIPPKRSCCNTAHPLIPTILARQASISKHAHTRTHTRRQTTEQTLTTTTHNV